MTPYSQFPPPSPDSPEVANSLRRVKDLLVAIAESTGAVVFSKDREGRYTFVNQACVDLWGLPRDEIVGKTDGELFPPETARQIVEADRRVIASGEPVALEEEVVFQGRRRVFNSSKVPLTDARGEVYALCGVATEITEQRLAHERKDEFLAVLGHELRNPIGTLQNCVEIMAMLPESDAARRAQGMLGRQVAQLARLVDDLLDLGRIATGQFRLTRRPLDLTSLTASVAEDFAGRFDTLGIEFRRELPERPVWVDGDRLRLGQAIANLLDNAAKYTSRGGWTTLSLAEDGDDVTVRVRDSGIGFRPGEIDLFEAFNGTGERDGLGLGLAIVKEICTRHEGDAEARSDGPGRGAEFELRLRRVSAPSREQLLHLVEDGAAAPLPSRRILVIDDNPSFLSSLAEVLKGWGHEVRTAPDGPSGIRAALERTPDYVLCDIDLGDDMDGYIVARRLRAHESTRDLCLIAITGFGQDRDRERALNAGFDAHLVKPIDFSELAKLLAALEPEDCPTECAVEETGGMGKVG